MRTKRPMLRVRGVDLAALAKNLREWEEKHKRIYLSPRDIAHQLKVHLNTVYTWLDSGTVFPSAVKTKDGWKIPLEDWEALKTSGRLRRLTREEVRPPKPMDKADAVHALHLKRFLISPCIYFLLNEHGRVLYIGQSISFIGRVGSHLRKIPGVCSVRIHRCSQAKLNDLEQQFIVKYQPPYNTVTTCGERLSGEYASYGEG